MKYSSEIKICTILATYLYVLLQLIINNIWWMIKSVLATLLVCSSLLIKLFGNSFFLISSLSPWNTYLYAERLSYLNVLKMQSYRTSINTIFCEKKWHYKTILRGKAIYIVFAPDMVSMSLPWTISVKNMLKSRQTATNLLP